MRLRVDSVSKAFGPTQALSNVTLEAIGGRILALLGENGSGKSTLMRILGGEDFPDSGGCFLNGRPHDPRSPRHAHDAGVALIHQEIVGCPHLSVAESIFLGAEPHRAGVLKFCEMNRTSTELLARLGHPKLDPEQPLLRLSPAERQVVEIARALRSEARVILFDEPTSSLSLPQVEALFVILRQLRAEGRTIIYIGHDLDEVLRICDDIVVLRDGQVVANLVRAEATVEGLPSLMAGRAVGQIFHRSDRTPGDPVLSLKSVETGTGVKVSDLSIRRGEVFGLAGLQGAGRTEALRAIFGLDPIRRGSLVRNGVPWSPLPSRSWRSGIGFVSEDRKREGLAQGLSLAENLTLPRLKTGIVKSRGITDRTDAVIQAFAVRCQGPNQVIARLSGGNQQKIALGRLMDCESQILLLDEPTRGIDVASKAEIYRWIDQWASDGRSILLASSYLPELIELCDRIAIFRNRELIDVVDARSAQPDEIIARCLGA